MHEKSRTFIALGLAQHGIGSFNVIAAGVWQNIDETTKETPSKALAVTKLEKK